jgi:DNA-binding HxlR family transcriptional regulator
MTEPDPSTNSELSYRQAVEEALAVLDGDWVVAVLTALAAGPLHFAQLVTAINAVEERVGRRIHQVPLSRQVLAPTLARLVDAELIIKTQDPTPHPSVWYRLTPAGRRLLNALRPLAEWAQVYHTEHPAAPRKRSSRAGRD